MIYLDNAATTAPDPEVIEAMLPYLRNGWQNPSSGYQASKKIREAVDDARTTVAALIDADPEEVVFTSGGTESNNTALFSLDHLLPKEVRFYSTQIEHSAVLRPLQKLEKLGRSVEYLPVNKKGRLECVSQVEGVATVMWANNETGVIQPISELVTAAKEKGITVHTDAVQAAGKVPISVKDNLVDLLSLSGHKFHGPKGVGALYIRSGLRMSPLLYGGGQESELRSGTENVPAIIGMAKAAEIAKQRLDVDPQQKRLAGVRDIFEQVVIAGVSGVSVNGDLENRLPSLSHLSFEDCEAAGLVILLDEYGVQCSAGSACMTGKQQPSHVQRAMGFSDTQANSSLRFSFSHEHSEDIAQQAAEIVIKAVKKLRSVQTTGIGPVVVYTP